MRTSVPHSKTIQKSSHLYDKPIQWKKTDKKIGRWIEKWGARTPWWIKFTKDEGYYF